MLAMVERFPSGCLARLFALHSVEVFNRRG